MVCLTTNYGDIKIDLFEDEAPGTTSNFLSYVDAGHYDGTIFHRVIDGFMIQGGGFTPQMQEKPSGAPIKNEAANGRLNERGTLAMARTPEVDSATAQFFINVVDNPFLNHKSTNPQEFGYCVFGRVIEGMDVVDKIKTVPTRTVGHHQNVPVEPVIIESATRCAE